MKRRLLNLLTAGSLLLFVAACVLWVRSYWVCDDFSWTGGRANTDLVASRGRVVWSRITGEAPVSSGDWPPFVHRTFEPRDLDAGAWADLAARSLPGVHYLQGPAARTTGVYMRVLTLPHYLLAALALTLPAARFVRRVRTRRGTNGVCPACGYDLRATPGRCPECGAGAGPASAA
jgi:hypothetical protein